MGISAAANSLVQASTLTGLIIGSLQDATPELVQEAQVVVYGNPNSQKYDLYWVAVSVAFGMVRRRDAFQALPPAGAISMQYNAELKQIYFSVVQITNWRSFAMRKLKGLQNDPIQLFAGPYSIDDNNIPVITDQFFGGPWQFNADLIGFPTTFTVWGLRMKNPIVFNGVLNVAWSGVEIITPKPTWFNPVTNTVTVSTSPTPPSEHGPLDHGFPNVSRGSETLAGTPEALAFAPNAWYRNPEYLLWSALSEPCNSQAEIPGGYVGTDEGGGGDFDGGGYIPKIPGGIPPGIQNPSGQTDFPPNQTFTYPPPSANFSYPPNTPNTAPPPQPLTDSQGNIIYPPEIPPDQDPDDDTGD